VAGAPTHLGAPSFPGRADIRAAPALSGGQPVLALALPTPQGFDGNPPQVIPLDSGWCPWGVANVRTPRVFRGALQRRLLGPQALTSLEVGRYDIWAILQGHHRKLSNPRGRGLALVIGKGRRRTEAFWRKGKGGMAGNHGEVRRSKAGRLGKGGLGYPDRPRRPGGSAFLAEPPGRGRFESRAGPCQEPEGVPAGRRAAVLAPALSLHHPPYLTDFAWYSGEPRMPAAVVSREVWPATTGGTQYCQPAWSRGRCRKSL
jgi:hypothetical protein